MASQEHAKKKKTGRTRTVTYSSQKTNAETDDQYLKDVRKLEEAFGTRGGYVLGEGALNKNDALYMMEEDEKRRREERKRKEEEAQRFKALVEREKKLLGAEEETVGDGIGDGETLVASGKRGAQTKKRKALKEMVRLRKDESAAPGSTGEEDAAENSQGDDADGGLTALFGEYNDSDSVE